ncbi:unnamed protein product [Closterium sp. NIES-65]|nr:unnamed protein product [Closterium sp. NIES-65]
MLVAVLLLLPQFSFPFPSSPSPSPVLLPLPQFSFPFPSSPSLPQFSFPFPSSPSLPQFSFPFPSSPSPSPVLLPLPQFSFPFPSSPSPSPVLLPAFRILTSSPGSSQTFCPPTFPLPSIDPDLLELRRFSALDDPNLLELRRFSALDLASPLKFVGNWVHRRSYFSWCKSSLSSRPPSFPLVSLCLHPSPLPPRPPPSAPFPPSRSQDVSGFGCKGARAPSHHGEPSGNFRFSDFPPPLSSHLSLYVMKGAEATLLCGEAFHCSGRPLGRHHGASLSLQQQAEGFLLCSHHLVR